MKASIIDLGYNSIKLVNYNIFQKNKKYRSYYDKSIRVKLGEGMHKSKILQPDAIERTVESIKYFGDIINIESIKNVIPFATSAVREAENKKTFLKIVEEQTGFKFKILSPEQEAFYSYIGALNSLCIPNCLFFDLGGGSLELVFTRDYKIKKIVSLPLGSLKLTQLFCDAREKNSSKESVGKSYLKLENYLLNSLPNRKELGIDIDSITLIGVGGTLRTLARYDQFIKEYPLKKLQNYNLKYTSLSLIKDHLLNMSIKEISAIDVIGSNRAETITTGLYTIYLLMSKLNFHNLIVSDNGIREGILLDFIYSLENSIGNISNPKAQCIRLNNYLVENCQKNSSSSMIMPFFINQLLSLEIINNYEYDIIRKAIPYLSKISNTISYLGKFYFLLDEDIPNINHEQQLILALSLISIYKPKISSDIAENYTYFLTLDSNKKTGKKIVEKISICLQLYKFLQKNKYLKILDFNKESRKMLISLTLSKEYVNYNIFLKEILNSFGSLFDISLEYSFLQCEKEIRR
jgi:exopolyphosphatase / guanosine-5'-triphosphate,3'-diphosphate pyrophosphatase